MCIRLRKLHEDHQIPADAHDWCQTVFSFNIPKYVSKYLTSNYRHVLGDRLELWPSIYWPYKGGPLYVINRKINNPVCHNKKVFFFLYAIYYRLLKIVYAINNFLICHEQENKKDYKGLYDINTKIIGPVCRKLKNPYGPSILSTLIITFVGTTTTAKTTVMKMTFSLNLTLGLILKYLFCFTLITLLFSELMKLVFKIIWTPSLSTRKSGKLDINFDKTTVLVFGTRNDDRFNFKLGENTIAICNDFKYLGSCFYKKQKFL